MINFKHSLLTASALFALSTSCGRMEHRDVEVLSTDNVQYGSESATGRYHQSTVSNEGVVLGLAGTESSGRAEQFIFEVGTDGADGCELKMGESIFRAGIDDIRFAYSDQVPVSAGGCTLILSKFTVSFDGEIVTYVPMPQATSLIELFSTDASVITYAPQNGEARGRATLTVTAGFDKTDLATPSEFELVLNNNGGVFSSKSDATMNDTAVNLQNSPIEIARISANSDGTVTVALTCADVLDTTAETCGVIQWDTANESEINIINTNIAVGMPTPNFTPEGLVAYMGSVSTEPTTATDDDVANTAFTSTGLTAVPVRGSDGAISTSIAKNSYYLVVVGAQASSALPHTYAYVYFE